MMKEFVLACGVVLCAFTSVAHQDGNGDGKKPASEKSFPSLITKSRSGNTVVTQQLDSLYQKINLEPAGLSKEVFEKAYTGYVYLLSQGRISKPGILTIADYSQPSSKKRLYVIDVNAGEIIFNTYVAHGKNSGAGMANSFSNATNSNKSSLGFMLTGETYVGSKGYSLRLDGMEPGINDNVRNRAVVMHGSAYVDASRASNGVMMGRSFGCPALSWGDHRQVIDEIKGGSVFFVYGNDMMYSQRSKILNAAFEWPVLASNATNNSSTSL